MKLPLKFVAFGLALVLLARPGFSQTVYCTNCASELTQILNLARLVDQLATQGNILKTNTYQYQNMTLNTTPWSSLKWGSGSSDIASVNSTLSGSGALSFASPSLSSLFNGQYNNYNGYLSATPTSATAAAKWQQWSNSANKSVLGTLQAGQAQSNQIAGDELSSINDLRTRIQGAQGNLQAEQTIGQIGLSNVEQLQKLRQLVLAHTSMQANSMQVQADRDTSQQAAWRKFLNTQTNIPTSGGKRF